MKLEEIKHHLGDFAKDTRLNLSRILTEEGAAGLTPLQIWGIALACAYSTRSARLIEALMDESTQTLTPAEVNAAKGASTLMAMNNVYYRFLHLCEDSEFSKLPASLRMNFIASPGVPKVDFELYCLAISALAGCGMCIKSHIHEALKAGISRTGVQSAVRIASVIQSTTQALFIADL